MDRILVAHGSKYGSTAQIAEAIGESLESEGFAVDVRPAHDVRSVEEYRAVVLGSAVYMKRWRSDALHLLQRHRRELAQRDVWLFNSGPVGEKAQVDDPEGMEWVRPEKVRQIGEEIGAHDDRVFGGAVAEDGGFIRRSMAKNTPEDLRDVRDWEAIRAWAREIASTLKASDRDAGTSGAA